MTIVGCDLHTRKQQVAVVHTDTGEVEEHELLHSDNAVEQFYSALLRPVTVGIESVASGPGQALDQPLPHRVAARRHHDGNRLRLVPDHEGGDSALGDDDVWVEA